MVRRILCLSIIFLLLISSASTAQESAYRITYTINVDDDGTAIWFVEYRTQLVSKEDFDTFENYTTRLKSVYLKEFKDLMVKSVSEAANATSRNMIAGGFTGDAKVETSPTGTYGVVHYSFAWTNFAKIDPDKNINISDVFVGGLYLSKDNTLIVKYPSGYMVEKVAPDPDNIRDGLIWYGLRSFKTGEPRISLLRTTVPWIQYAIFIFAGFAIAAGVYIYLFKVRGKKATEIVSEPQDIKETITETDLMNLEEMIIKLLKESGGSMYQSDIGKKLGLPKSTVSSALNGLNTKNLIQKIKKGRENLIRLV